MPTPITPGRYRHLKSTSTHRSVFTILAFDQRGSYRKMLPDGTSYERAVEIKRDIVVALSYNSSAVLLDNQYGLQPALEMSGASGLLLSLEESGYTGDSTYRRVTFDPNWTVAKIKRMGGSAIKLLVYYHPETGALADEIDGVVRSVADECHKYDMPLFLEPLSYSLDASIAKESPEFAATRPAVVIETARRLSQTGADILKMEFPYDAAYHTNQAEWHTACEAISAASTVPWVLLSAGVDFDTFTDQVRVACQSGASGWLAGRAIWKEAAKMTDEQRKQFLATTANDRLRTLVALAEQYAKPWTEFYTPGASFTNDWFNSYDAI